MLLSTVTITFWSFKERLHNAFIGAQEATEKRKQCERIEKEARGKYIGLREQAMVKEPKELPKLIETWPTGKPYNIDHLARAIAWAETNHCTKGYGKMYNNCFWIRNGNTAPCPKIWINNMCIYDTPEQSYDAFRVIRSTRYDGMPNMKKAERRTGKHNAQTRLNNVNYLYYNN